MKAPLGFLPKARREGIITKEVDGELLIYDRDRDKAHCLNPSAAAIWKLCNGRTTTDQISSSLSKDKGGAVDEAIVWLALAELRRTHLLEDYDWTQPGPQTILGMSRREAVRRIGLGAAIALPIVISITAPTPAQAGSPCKPANQACTQEIECCSGVCTGNVCIGDA
ncbi:MAG TPA: PqqD family protein [Pyrinomonadaceae bacterium]|nr:PqqD family protein [Pyrinomonadaceae bacterium]